jgi:large subunit ribosomal protein L17
MRHRVKAKHFNRDANHRKMLLRNLVRSLIEHGEITTTEAKAKETRRWTDRFINQARTNSVAVRRTLHAYFGKRDVVNALVEKIAPAFGKRASGYTTIVRLGKRRGDNVELVKLSLLELPKNLHTLKAEAAADRPSKKKKSGKKKSAAKPKTENKAAAAVRQDARKAEAKPMTAQPTQRVQRKLAQKGQ